MKIRTITTLAAGALAALMVLSGCGNASANTNTNSANNASGDTASSQTDTSVNGTITVYTSEPQNKLDALIKDFNEVVPNVKVQSFRAGTGDLNARIESEQANGGVKADILWAADASTFEKYKKSDSLAKYTPKEADKLIDGVTDADGYYTGTRVIPTVIAYNTNAIKTAPDSWKSLADPQYNGKIVMPNPSVSGAAAYNAAVWYLDKNLGEQWFTELGKNKPVIADSNGPVSQAVASGTQPVGVVVDYLIRDLKTKGSPVAVAYPSEGVPFVSEPIGIFKSTKNEKAAQAFIDYVLSVRGQKLAVKQNYLPVRNDAGSPEGAPELDKIKLLNPDLATVTENKETALKSFTAHVG
ncbi:ABC transporter substrate-binding protein [Bifidobacterium hapali]|uniref:ABC transporter substrate-binding protein n=1 Tax=Bifidobacterium hapali TaxID=1630172 RepID=A0A261G173_9BIFI|nr:ABC transporter substrate-binding protein [Bifidobacterium hapali]OZG64923.1 ABC transporter substrate-binding protein [Bifidobacterium hapali]